MGKIESQIMDGEVVEVPVRDFRTDIDGIISKIDDNTKIVYIDNPNNIWAKIGEGNCRRERKDKISIVSGDILKAVFITGMIRSGTTLLEKILTNHMAFRT
jgi:hypothetical protein